MKVGTATGTVLGLAVEFEAAADIHEVGCPYMYVHTRSSSDSTCATLLEAAFYTRTVGEGEGFDA